MNNIIMFWNPIKFSPSGGFIDLLQMDKNLLEINQQSTDWMIKSLSSLKGLAWSKGWSNGIYGSPTDCAMYVKDVDV